MKLLYRTFFKQLFFVFTPLLVWSQAPTDLTSNIALPTDPPTNTYTNSSNGPYFLNISQITNSFNYARRQEEIQLGLPTNSLGTLSLPSSYASSSASQRAAYLVNAERKARAGVTYPISGSVLGLPLEGVETNLSAVSQSHADNMMTAGIFSHTLNGSTSSDRINASSTFAGSCHEFIARDENIYKQCLYTSSSTPPANPIYAIEQAIFSWLYQDSPSWGHRDGLLMQNISGDLPTPGSPSTNAYDNNYSSALNEGFLGVGITYGSAANSLSTGIGGICPPSSSSTIQTKTAAVVVFNFVDPAASGCTYSLESNPLPVNLVSFSGVARENKAELSWVTAWERTNEGFEIQRSSDGRAWEKIGFVAGKDILTNSNLYQFDDTAVQIGFTYLYRLKQRDYDGQFTYSQIVAVKIVPTNELVYAYPNPSPQGEFTVFTTQAATASVEIRDTQGNTYPVTAQASGQTRLIVKLKDMPAAGVYFMTVKSDTTFVPNRTIKVIVGE